MSNTIGWTIATVLGVAILCGVGKLVRDMTKAQVPPRRRQPWELD
jgi:hypothetical protein